MKLGIYHKNIFFTYSRFLYRKRNNFDNSNKNFCEFGSSAAMLSIKGIK